MNKSVYYASVLLLLGAVVLLCPRHSRPGHQASAGSEPASDEPVSVRQSAGSNDPGELTKPGVADSVVAEIKAALESFKHLPDADARAGFDALLRHWAELDEPGALEYANSLDDREMKQEAIRTVADVLSHSDPRFLAQRILAMPGSGSSRMLIHELAEVWSQTDVQSALAWAEQLPEGSDKEAALVTIRSQLAAQDPEAASAQAAQLSESDSTSGLIVTIAEHWALSNPTKAVAWANTLPDSEKTLALADMAGVWAQHDPVAAANFVADLPVGEMQNQAARSVISSWANQNPEATAAWVLEFPAGDLRDQGINVVVTDWNMLEPGQAQAWVLGLPAGATQDIALKSFAESIVYSINDPAAQEQYLETIMRSWSEDDPAAARNWLAGWNGAADLKARLQSSLSAN